MWVWVCEGVGNSRREHRNRSVTPELQKEQEMVKLISCKSFDLLQGSYPLYDERLKNLQNQSVE